MPLDEFKRTAIDAYPLHPLTLVVLPYIFRRFGQNERSLFSYLSSGEPYGFQEFVKTRPMSSVSPEFIRLGGLFDYFSSNFGMGLSFRSTRPFNNFALKLLALCGSGLKKESFCTHELGRT